jgi:glucose uptake protein GlcU
LKQVDCGDGFFFAMIMSFGILLVGVIVNFTPLSTGGWWVVTGTAPNFHPLAALGGVMWMAGNFLTPTVIRRIGLGLGLTVWDLSNMMIGWATGTYGLFGVWKEEVQNIVFNRVGLLLCVVSLIFFVQAGQQDIHQEEEHEPDMVERAQRTMTRLTTSGFFFPSGISVGGTDDESEESLTETEAEDSADNGRGEARTTTLSSRAPRRNTGRTHTTLGTWRVSWAPEIEEGVPGSDDIEMDSAIEDNLERPDRKKTRLQTVGEAISPAANYLVGVVLALAAGLLFGCTFDMPTLLQQCGIMQEQAAQGIPIEEHWDAVCNMTDASGCSPYAIDYVFSHYVGIMFTGVLVFLVYVLMYRREAYVKKELVLPSLASGVMWGVAQTAWFKANAILSLSIAFPIISTLPGIVALTIGFCCYGEFATRNSRILALIGLCCRLPGVALIALSN